MSRLGQNSTFKSSKKEIKAFIHKRQWKEALIFLCFVLLAGAFWMLQSLQQEYEIDVDIPVEYRNIPSDIAFNDTLPEIIKLKVKDKGSVLLNYSFGRQFIPIEINLKSLAHKDGHITLSKKELENDLKKQLLATTTLIGFEPSVIDLKYGKQSEKEVPVVFNGNIQTKAGYKIVGEPTFIPTMVKVYAPKSVLDTLKEVKTSFLSAKTASKTIKQNVTLQKIKNAKISPSQVAFSIPIEECTEKTLDVPVICPDIPETYTLRTFPASVKVSCSVPLSYFKTLSANQFSISIPFEEFEQNLSGTMIIKLDTKPDYVDNIVLTPSKIEFIIEQSK